MKRIAIIPARGGSKRIPKKNIKDFCGKPIIYYTIDYARKSNLFDVIHVSTDDKEIIEEIAKINCVPRFFRPKNLSDDPTTLVSVLKFVVKKFERLGMKFDEVWLLMACASSFDSSGFIKC
jgi:CMP-N-acetylneuraminic acid synthetase